MRKLIIITLVAVAAAASIVYAGGVLQSDGVPNAPGRMKIQGFAPDGKKSQALTVNRSGTISLSTSASYGAYSPTDCVYRIQSTATRAGLNHTLPGGQRLVNVVHENTPFVSYSGCASGIFQRD